ncbi:MAG: IS1380 family transposase [Methanobacteriaceae archaeon]|nr:IS1380 family transposase [Methanobacteriaceae archaeon]
MEIKIAFTDKDISPWGGMSLMKTLVAKSKIEEKLQELNLPEPGSNRGYKPIDIIKSFWLSIWCGANRFIHTEVTRQDKVMQEVYGLKAIPSHTTIKRFFNKFSLSRNNEVFTELYQWYFKQLEFDNYALDFDSSVFTRYGEQEGAKRGYNPNKPGRKSHHPLMAFVSGLNMVANFWLRPGNTGATSNFINFLEDTLLKLKGKKIGLLRADSGFYGENIFKHLENIERPINYIIAARLYRPVKIAISRVKKWIPIAPGIDISEVEYRGYQWKKSRRMVIVRQSIKVRPNATGKKLRLFEFEDLYENYRYSSFVTNLDLPCQEIWKLYRSRADAENRIKELKYDFGLDSFNLTDFYATEAALNFVMIAYNLMSLFSLTIVNSPVAHRLSTLRFKMFAIGSYMIKNGNDRILKLSLAMKRREWFTGLWDKTKVFQLPINLQYKMSIE